jgi:hypothetical protein
MVTAAVIVAVVTGEVVPATLVVVVPAARTVAMVMLVEMDNAGGAVAVAVVAGALVAMVMARAFCELLADRDFRMNVAIVSLAFAFDLVDDLLAFAISALANGGSRLFASFLVDGAGDVSVLVVALFYGNLAAGAFVSVSIALIGTASLIATCCRCAGGCGGGSVCIDRLVTSRGDGAVS